MGTNALTLGTPGTVVHRGRPDRPQRILGSARSFFPTVGANCVAVFLHQFRWLDVLSRHLEQQSLQRLSVRLAEFINRPLQQPSVRTCLYARMLRSGPLRLSPTAHDR